MTSPPWSLPLGLSVLSTGFGSALGFRGRARGCQLPTVLLVCDPVHALHKSGQRLNKLPGTMIINALALFPSSLSPLPSSQHTHPLPHTLLPSSGAWVWSFFSRLEFEGARGTAADLRRPEYFFLPFPPSGLSKIMHQPCELMTFSPSHLEECAMEAFNIFSP